MKMLHYDLHSAFDSGEPRHAQTVLKSMGVTYLHEVPQSIADCWWFYGPQNLPEPLPDYMSVREVNPIDHVGWGLSEEKAKFLLEMESKWT